MTDAATDYRALAEQAVLLGHDMTARLRQLGESKVFQGDDLVLMYLENNGGKGVAKDISAWGRVSRARVTTIVKQLEEAGLIKRSEDPNDSRYILIELTDSGYDHIKKVREHKIDHFSQFLEGFGPEDAVEYIRLQAKAIEILDDIRRRKAVDDVESLNRFDS